MGKVSLGLKNAFSYSGMNKNNIMYLYVITVILNSSNQHKYLSSEL